MKRMQRLGFWFKGVLAAGLLLAVLLVGQSILGYFRLGRVIVADQVQKEAEQQIHSLERELRQAEGWDPVRWKSILEEFLSDTGKKIAWLEILDGTGAPLLRAGRDGRAEITPRQIQAAGRDRAWISEERSSAGGKVVIALLPIRFRPVRSVPGGADDRSARPPETSSGPRLAAVAVYLDSVAAAFIPLQQGLTVSCLAALVLAASMAFLWWQFPRYVRGKQLEEQLELARHVQTDLLPSPCSKVEDIDFAASCVPAWQVGGDFYDVFPAGHGRTAFVLGDVSGKGIPAALLMGLLQGAVRSACWWNSTVEHETATRRLNDLLHARTSPDRFVSLFWGCYDPDTRLLRYVNAGHLPPALIRRQADGGFQVLRLDKGGPILGILPAVRYRQGEIRLEPGDTLVMYSDGIVEAAGPTGLEFGEDRLFGSIEKLWALPAQSMRNAVLKEVDSYLASRQPQDDMTLAVLRMEAGEALPAEAEKPTVTWLRELAPAQPLWAYQERVPERFTSI